MKLIDILLGIFATIVVWSCIIMALILVAISIQPLLVLPL